MSTKDDLFNNIGNNGNEPKNIKKILIYGAIVFLIFVIGIIGFAVVQNNRNSDKDTIIPPEENKPKQENLFKQIPIENGNTQNNVTQNNNNEKNSIKENIIKNSTNEVKENVNQPTVTKTEPSQVVKENTMPVNKEPSIQKPKKVEKPEIKNPPKKEPEVFIPTPKKKITKQEPKKVEKKQVIKNRYYIQVAALLRYKKPNPKFLELIRKNGYEYRFLVTYAKIKDEKVKVTKILIGPFATKKEAKKALKKVKSNITQNAFIFKVK